MAIYQLKMRRVKVSDKTPMPIKTSVHAVNYLRKFCFMPEEMWRESLHAVFLDRGNIPVGHMLISTGSATETVFDHTTLIRATLESGAKSVLLAHNHPSGDPKPGQRDIVETEQFKKALRCFDINLLDHIVLCDENYYSFVEEIVKPNPKN